MKQKRGHLLSELGVSAAVMAAVVIPCAVEEYRAFDAWGKAIIEANQACTKANVELTRAGIAAVGSW